MPLGTARRRYAGRVVRQWEQVNVDAADPVALGRWWQAALGRVVVDTDPGCFEIRPQPDLLPGLLFAPVPEGNEFCVLGSR